MSFRRRQYTEVLDNLLTSAVGGVSGESHAYPPAAGTGPFTHPLERPPVGRIVSVYGTRNGQSTAFTPDLDFALSRDGKRLEWLAGGQLPDAGTLLNVNYVPATSAAPYDDLHVGSVLRTLAEAIGLETARLYAELEGVYKSGFIDTAVGAALDNVVALLGIDRVRAGRFSCELEFHRALGSRGDIHIPAGTRVMNEDGSVEYETLSPVTMSEGQSVVRVSARDRENNTEGLPADELTVMAKPLAGVSSVTNAAPTSIDQQGENDDDLRHRAKGFLHASERATLGAIREAVARQGLAADVEELVDAEGHATGTVRVTPHAESLPPDQLARVTRALEDARPAGVRVYVESKVEPPVSVNLKLRVTTSQTLLEHELRAAHESARQKVATYFEKLAVKESGSVNKLIGLVLAVPEIEDLQFLAADITGLGAIDLGSGQLGVAGKTTRLGSLNLVDPNLPTQVSVVIRYPISKTVPDPAAVESALTQFVDKVNSANDAATPTVSGISKALLLFTTPLPIVGKAQGTFDEAAGAPALPASAALQGYTVEYIFTQQTGVTQSLVADADSYALTPFERLTVGDVKISAKADA